MTIIGPLSAEDRMLLEAMWEVDALPRPSKPIAPMYVPAAREVLPEGLWTLRDWLESQENG